MRTNAQESPVLGRFLRVSCLAALCVACACRARPAIDITDVTFDAADRSTIHATLCKP